MALRESMEKLDSFVKKFTKYISWVGCMVLVAMMLLTVVDVVLRWMRMGITGTFELMSFGGALVVGFAIAQTSVDGAHVSVDVVTQLLGKRANVVLSVITRVMSIVFFLLLGWGLFLKGNELFASGEVSLTLHVPFYPVAYALALSSVVESAYLFVTLVKTIIGGAGNE
jgi:TRAP-type C4-dicarboxylate transport system permease small subunit